MCPGVVECRNDSSCRAVLEAGCDVGPERSGLATIGYLIQCFWNAPDAAAEISCSRRGR
jgi:hypothetical protein